MASKSRAAQQALSELEKGSAQFEELLVEAVKFIGADLDALSKSAEDGRDQRNASTSHGKEEWLLKWLLKKLQAPKDDVPRKTLLSWNLLLHLLRKLPLSIAARILGERKFVSILQKSLEEENQRPVEERPRSVDGNDTPKKSKKRKRSGDLVGKLSVQNHGVKALFGGILAVVEFIVDSTRPSTGKDNEGRDSEFSAEYMRTVLRSSAEDSAKLLGSWLSVLKKHDILLLSDQSPWLSSFIEIWQLHITDDNYLIHFSLHCTLPLLSLLGALPKPSHFGAQIEQLLARNIIIPSKAAKEENVESKLLEDLTKIAVISDSSNASRLFEIAIRSIQPQSSKRRRPNDETWLQTVFSSLRGSMPQKRADQNGRAIYTMVQSALLHRVELELDVSRSVTSAYALPEGGETYWELLHLIIKFDANVFLIPNTARDLLQDLLTRIRQVSVGREYLNLSKIVIEDVVVPLMGAFAKARDLSGFVHHWLFQLIELERSRKALNLSPFLGLFGAWEDARLQQELKRLLEASLSTNQIIQLLDWLETQILENPGPVLVLLQAISGSVSGEEVVDAVNLRCYHIIFDNNALDNLDVRYEWRPWRILSDTLSFANRAGTEELSSLWAESAKPFDSFSEAFGSSERMNIQSATNSYGALELWKFACVAWSVAKDGSRLQNLARPLVLDLLKRFSSEVGLFLQTTQKNQRNLGKQMMSHFVQCIFKDYPKVLVLAADSDGKAFRETLKIIFWIASASDCGAVFSHDIPDLSIMSFPDLWLSALRGDCVLNNTILAEMMIDTMLDNETHSSNPLINFPNNNFLTIKSLLQVPISILHRKHRERVMKAWLPFSSGSDNVQEMIYNSAGLDPAVLALKIKTMRFPMFYEGMDFQQLSKMAAALATSKVQNPLVSLTLFKELSRLTLDFIFTNIDQSRNQEYIKDAFTYVQKSAKRSHKHMKHESAFSSIALFEVVLGVIRANTEVLFRTEAIKKKDLSKVETLVEDSLFIQLQASLQELCDETAERDNDLAIVSILDAFTALGLDREKAREIQNSTQTIRNGETEASIDVTNRLNVFLASQTTEDLDNELGGTDCSSIHGRLSIREQTRSAMSADKDGKMRLVTSILSGSTVSSLQLGQLLAVRQIILSVDEDTRRSKRGEDSDSDSSDEDEESLDLSEAYSLLCGQLQKAKGIRQFCIISETLEMMLRTKARSISQWNIDNTLGSISIVCSRNGPTLRASRGSTIYLHLCHLFQAVLVSHRLKLEGHFHLVVQAIQSLLRCLFTPLPHSNTKSLKHYAPPPWLHTTHPLTGMHASTFTRLITLICDPSVSSVTRSSHNNLTSATEKAKRMAGQHMQFVLMSYVRLQLEMKMFPEVREKMVPGLYAIFDTTTAELRKGISEGLDSSGRAVFGVLYRDFVRFGKWKGS